MENTTPLEKERSIPSFLESQIGMGSIKIPSMSNIVANSGIRRGIRRIKPYVLNRSGRKPRARE